MADKNPIKRRWRHMMDRCYIQSDKSYPRYGGRGIFVCERWKVFAFFSADVGQAPPGKSIDRIDNDGPYSPDNFRWATPKEQANNTRRNRLITARGRTMPLHCWAEELGIGNDTLKERLNSGLSADEALFSKAWSIADAARAFGIKPCTLHERLRRKWSLSRALFEPVHRHTRI